LTATAVPSAAQTIKFLAVNPQQVGLAAPADLGLPTALWKGSTRESLVEAVDSVAGTASLLSAHQALRDLLIADAPLPEGKALDPPLTALRVRALARLGASQEALSLAERAPDEFRTGTLLDAEREARLLRYDLSGACGLLRETAAQATQPDWQRLRAVCRQIFGEDAEATVAAILAEIVQPASDETFGALFLAMQYPERPKPAGLLPERPLHLAMLRFLQLPLALNSGLPPNPPALLAGIAATPRVPPGLRVRAAEQAVAANAGAVEPLIQLYLQTGATEGLAPLYRQAAYAANATERQDGLQQLWEEARQRELLAQFAPYTLGLAATLDKDSLPAPFLKMAIRVALLSGEPAAITAWRNGVEAKAGQPDGKAVFDTSLPLLAIAGEPLPPATQWWSDWLAAAKPTDQQQQLAGGLMGALGQSFAIAPSPQIPATAVTQPILNAKDAPGEAALRALAALSQAEDPDAALQVIAVRALAKVHPGHARALAVELAIAAGL